MFFHCSFAIADKIMETPVTIHLVIIFIVIVKGAALKCDYLTSEREDKKIFFLQRKIWKVMSNEMHPSALPRLCNE